MIRVHFELPAGKERLLTIRFYRLSDSLTSMAMSGVLAADYKPLEGDSLLLRALMRALANPRGDVGAVSIEADGSMQRVTAWLDRADHAEQVYRRTLAALRRVDGRVIQVQRLCPTALAVQTHKPPSPARVVLHRDRFFTTRNRHSRLGTRIGVAYDRNGYVFNGGMNYAI